MPRAVLDRLVELCAERDAVLFCDEVYRELEHDPARPPAGGLRPRTSARVSLGSVSKTYGLPGLRTGWIACRDRTRCATRSSRSSSTRRSARARRASCSPRSRYATASALVERNRALVLENLALADAFVERMPALVDWVRPNASPIGFPRLRVARHDGFCEQLAADAGVLLLPGEVYDEPGHVRFGLGRLGTAEAFARLAGSSG